jgi:hypothetical protein
MKTVTGGFTLQRAFSSDAILKLASVAIELCFMACFESLATRTFLVTKLLQLTSTDLFSNSTSSFCVIGSFFKSCDHSSSSIIVSLDKSIVRLDG